MTCPWTRHPEADLARETLPEEKREKLAAHLRSCERCQTLAAHLDELLGVFDSVQNASLSAQFWPLLHARLQARDAIRNKAYERAMIRPGRLRAVTASICLLVGTMAGIYLGDSYIAGDGGQRELPEASAPFEEAVPLLEVAQEMCLPSLAELVDMAPHVEAKGEPEP